MALCPSLPAQAQAQAEAASAAPQAERRDHVVNWHGHAVNDPWFWLREKDSPAVLGYLHAENAFTEAATRSLGPLAKTVYAEMLGRIQQSDLDVPVRRAGWLYYSRTVEGQQYPIHCRRKAPEAARDEPGPEEVLLDVNEMARGKPS